MEIALFDFLEGLSPWWWLAAGVAMGAVEMATMSFFLIWPALAAAVMAAVVYAKPDLSGEAQVLIFAILAVVITFAGRALVHRFGDGGDAQTAINKRSEALVGRNAKVLEQTGREGAVEIDGIRWKAVWNDGNSAPGETVEIMAADGMILRVSPAA